MKSMQYLKYFKNLNKCFMRTEMCLTWLLDWIHTMCFGKKHRNSVVRKLQRALLRVLVSPEIQEILVNECCDSFISCNSLSGPNSESVWSGSEEEWESNPGGTASTQYCRSPVFKGRCLRIKKKGLWVTPFISRWGNKAFNIRSKL